MENDELASSLKADFLDQITRSKKRDALKKKREDLRELAYKYADTSRRKLDIIDAELATMNVEENRLYSIVDQYDDEISGSPRFTEETMSLLIQFMKEYKKGAE